ncbi:MAG TPA: hypothetical protein VGM19_08725 [Armatimonadota bacterium]|jgi:hypothetical protein
MSSDLAALRAGQAERVRQYLQAAADRAESWFNEKGEWVIDEAPLFSRERLWVSFALYAGTESQQRLADAVVLGTEVEEYDGFRFNIFDSNIAPILYIQHHERMSHEAKHALLDLTAEGHNAFPGDRQADYQFHGYNDNMPAKGTMSLILGGELVQSSVAVAHGRWQLRQFQEELYRDGVGAEYNSPTYSALTVHAMAEIAEYADSPRDREVARLLERRLWADLACHWHPSSHQQAGPHSRSYTVDTIGHLSCVRSLIWTVLGDEATGLSPMALFDPPAWLVTHHCGNLTFNIAQMCWFVAGHYHLDDDLARLFVEKPNPFQIVATTEHGDTGEMPCRQAVTTTYMTEDYSLGTSSTGYGNGGQPSAFFVTYPRAGQEPVGSTIHCRYTLNEQMPGICGEDRGWQDEDFVPNHAHYVTLQQGPTALVSAHVAALGEIPISRLSQMVAWGTHLAPVEELRVGSEAIGDWAGEYSPKQWFGVRAGRCLLALRPLAFSLSGLPVTVRLESLPHYQVLTIDNYRGPERQFSPAELLGTFNGFAAEVAGVDEYGSLEEFLGYLQEAASFEDYALFNTRRPRYLRSAIPGREAVDLATCYTVHDCSARYATINGRQLAQTVWAATGLPEEAVSVMPGGYQPRPTGIPWESLEILWDRTVPWGINESGK